MVPSITPNESMYLTHCFLTVLLFIIYILKHKKTVKNAVIVLTCDSCTSRYC